MASENSTFSSLCGGGQIWTGFGTEGRLEVSRLLRQDLGYCPAWRDCLNDEKAQKCSEMYTSESLLFVLGCTGPALAATLTSAQVQSTATAK